MERRSIVSRKRESRANMIRFCVDPQGIVVPDIKAVLPGRGAWVELSKSALEQAIAKGVFVRSLKGNGSLKGDICVLPDLVHQVELLLKQAVLGSLSLARRGGGVITGAQKVENVVRRGQACVVFHALEAADDGRRKIEQAIFAAKRQGLGEVVVEAIFTQEQLSLAFGGNHVIHVAIIKGQAVDGLLEKLRRLKLYCAS